jgi:hypothetical protein
VDGSEAHRAAPTSVKLASAVTKTFDVLAAMRPTSQAARLPLPQAPAKLPALYPAEFLAVPL